MTMTMMMMASVFTKMPRFARLAFPLGAMDSARRASTQQLSIQLLPPKAYLSILSPSYEWVSTHLPIDQNHSKNQWFQSHGYHGYHGIIIDSDNHSHYTKVMIFMIINGIMGMMIRIKIPTVKTAETRLVADEVNQAISNPTEHQVEEEGQEEDDLCHLPWYGMDGIWSMGTD